MNPACNRGRFLNLLVRKSDQQTERSLHDQKMAPSREALSSSFKEHKKWYIIGGVGLCVVLILGISLGVGLNSDDSRSKEDLVLEAISEESEFPEGSFQLKLSSLKEGNPEAAPKNFSTQDLNSWGIQVEQTSFIAESGRLTFLYIWLPAADVIQEQSNRQKRSPSQLSGQPSIGIQFQGSNNIKVVPLSLASPDLNTGLREVKNLGPDGRVFELQVRMPVLECSSDQDSACFVSNWQPVTIGADNMTAAGADFWNSMPVSCGSQCDKPGDSPCSVSCDRCDGEQTIAGADTPVTRRFKMGSSGGNFSFQYETYELKDRVTIIHDGQNILDSSCVGTNGQRRQTVTFLGKQKEVVVNVEPNCEGTTGTEWYFTIGCPQPCSMPGTGDIGVILLNGIERVESGGQVYLDEDGNMPELEAYYCKTTSNSVRWSLKIEKLEHKDVTLCPEKIQEGMGSQWSFKPDNGGSATLTWETASGTKGSLTFNILGTNPGEAQVVTAVGPTPWYAQYVARHENYLKQFEKSGKPTITSDGGVGIFQLTNPQASCSQVWNWKENVAEGVRRLKNFASQAKTWMDDQRLQAKNENDGQNQPVPRRVEENCVFEDGTSRTIEDAVAMKMYNGASRGNYCAWDNGNNKWKFNTMNSQNFNYVKRVCSLVPGN